MPLAKLVEEHYLKDGLKRPLKIAVDEAHWRFNNVSPQQVAMIRRSKQHVLEQALSQSDT